MGAGVVEASVFALVAGQCKCPATNRDGLDPPVRELVDVGNLVPAGFRRLGHERYRRMGYVKRRALRSRRDGASPVRLKGVSPKS